MFPFSITLAINVISVKNPKSRLYILAPEIIKMLLLCIYALTFSIIFVII